MKPSISWRVEQKFRTLLSWFRSLCLTSAIITNLLIRGHQTGCFSFKFAWHNKFVGLSASLTHSLHWHKTRKLHVYTQHCSKNSKTTIVSLINGLVNNLWSATDAYVNWRIRQSQADKQQNLLVECLHPRPVNKAMCQSRSASSHVTVDRMLIWGNGWIHLKSKFDKAMWKRKLGNYLRWAFLALASQHLSELLQPTGS